MTLPNHRLLTSLTILTTFVPALLSCADHTGTQRPHSKRADDPQNPLNPLGKEWAYDASYNWGAIRSDYELCQTGTQQAPIPLSLVGGLSTFHQPTFTSYDRNVSGDWSNWGYGPGFTLSHSENEYTGLPAVHWDDQVGYLKGWHIHTPADHSVNRDRSKAEIHLVHVNADGKEVAVMAVLLDGGNFAHPFFAQLPEMQPFKDPKTVGDVEMGFESLLASVNHFNEFWTYKGSLTSPPCMEGIRWFVARNVAFMSSEQMRDILKVSTYSAREEQKVWMHEINSM